MELNYDPSREGGQMSELKSGPLSEEGLKVLGEMRRQTGDPIGADELADGIKEAAKRIGQGCKHCGDKNAETRYGMCFPCFDKP